MEKKLEKGAKVRVESFCGKFEEPYIGDNYKVIGQEGYVHEILNDEWVTVVIPTHLYHSKDGGVLLRRNEFELV